MILLALAACITPDPRPVLDAVADASPLAWIGARAYAVATVRDDACVTERTPCAEAPCTGAFTAEVGEACPLPFAPDARGTVTAGVAGEDLDSMALAATFDAVTVDGTPLAIASVAGALFAVADADADADDPTWTLGWIEIDVGRTPHGGSGLTEGVLALAAHDGDPDDPADDRFVLSGAAQWASGDDAGAHARQAILSDITFGPACPLNPTSGAGGIQVADAGEARTWVDEMVVQFADRCDGTADVYSLTSGTPQSIAEVYVTARGSP